jgi:hypothetical protein
LLEHGLEVSLSYHRSRAGFTGKSFSSQTVGRVGPPSFLISVITDFRISVLHLDSNSPVDERLSQTVRPVKEPGARLAEMGRPDMRDGVQPWQELA